MIKKTTLLTLLAAAAMAQDGFGDAADGLGDAADDFADDAGDAADEGAAIADGAEDDAAAIAADAEGDAVDAAKDGANAAKEGAPEAQNAAAAENADSGDWRYWKDPDLWIGIIDCVDVAWWLIWGWFVYIKTNNSDDMVRSDGNAATYDALPIAWFWYNLGHPTKFYTAIQYLFVWLFYLIIAVPGMIFWIWQLVEADEDRCNGASGTWLFKIWSEWPGLYGSWILYFLTVVMPIVHLSQIGEISQPGWINSVVQLSMMTLTWLATGIIHVLFTPALKQKYTDLCENKATPAAKPAEEVKVPVVEDEEPEVDDGNDWD